MLHITLPAWLPRPTAIGSKRSRCPCRRPKRLHAVSCRCGRDIITMAQQVIQRVPNTTLDNNTPAAPSRMKYKSICRKSLQLYGIPKIGLHTWNIPVSGTSGTWRRPARAVPTVPALSYNRPPWCRRPRLPAQLITSSDPHPNRASVPARQQLSHARFPHARPQPLQGPELTRKNPGIKARNTQQLRADRISFPLATSPLRWMLCSMRAYRTL